MAAKHGATKRFSHERAQGWIDALLERADMGEPAAVKAAMELYSGYLASIEEQPDTTIRDVLREVR